MRFILSKLNSHPHATTRTSAAKANHTRKLIRIQRKELSTDTWNCYGVLKWQSLLPTSLWRKFETDILSQSVTKLLIWKRFADDVYSLGVVDKEKITKFLEQANKHYSTIKFTAEISGTETRFLDTKVYKGERFKNEVVLDVPTYFKPTETLQHTHYYLCHPQAFRLLKTKLKTSNSTFRKVTQKIGYRKHFLK